MKLCHLGHGALLKSHRPSNKTPVLNTRILHSSVCPGSPGNSQSNISSSCCSWRLPEDPVAEETPEFLHGIQRK